MRRFFAIFCLFSLFSCSDGRDQVPRIEEVTEAESGYLEFSQTSLNFEGSSEILPSGSGYSTRSSSNFDDYNILIFNDKDSTTLFDGKFGDLLEIGQLSAAPSVYNIVVSSPKNESVDEWGEPIYGAQRVISIVKGQTIEVEDFNCSLQNIRVSVNIDTSSGDKFLSDELSTTPLSIGVRIGEKSVTFARDEVRSAYFDASASGEEMELSLSGMYNISEEGQSAEYVLISNYTESVSKVYCGQWHTVSIKADGTFEVDLQSGFTTDDWLYDDLLDIK